MYFSKLPDLREGADAPAFTDEQRATMQQAEPGEEIRTEVPSMPAQVDEPTSTEDFLLITTSSARSIALISFTLPSSRPSLPSITIPVIVKEASGVGGVGQTSMSTPNVQRNSWLVIGAAIFLGAAL